MLAGDDDAAEPASPGAARGLALVVEDNMLIAMEAEDQLRDLGFAACMAAAGVARALELIAAHDFAFALLDINLGHESSAEVAEVLRARDVPFVLASGYGEGGATDPRFAGAPVVAKPYTAAEIGTVLQRIDGLG
ncbi:MAG: response regulator [Sphingomonadales bacterium]|nr:response regulator [Sphingomonadales bacterium]